MNDIFRKNAVNYLASPPIKSNFKKTFDNLLALALNHTKNKQVDLNEYFNFVFPRSNAVNISPILICCSENIENETGLTELCAALRQAKCIPSVFHFKDSQNLKQTLSKMVSAIYEKISPSPSTESRFLSAIDGPCTSRYQTEFLNEEFIGVGGFGKVYKAKSKYDNCMYAVKKITLKKNDNNLTEKILSEVQLLASLNHANVIRYHCGWVEETFEDIVESNSTRKFQQLDEIRIQEITEDEAAKFQINDDKHHVEEPITPISRKKSSDSDVWSTASSEEENKQSPGHLTGKFWGNVGDSSDNESAEMIQESQGSSTASEGQVTKRQIQRKISPPTFFNNSPTFVRRLFIQMELCSKTLEDYIIERNKNVALSQFPTVDGGFNRDCIMQLLSALQYIHARHIIHRDIKPGNIFLKPDGRKMRVLLGDFGLACADSTDLNEDAEEMLLRPIKRERLLSQHSIGVGTTTYAAPEQLQSSDYGSAVDLYSAGIVLFEAYNVFLTSMEKMKHIEKLRIDRVVTDYLKDKWSTVAPLVLEMTDICPTKRPTAGQLLSRLLGDESQTNKQFQEIIAAQHEEIKVLREKLRETKKELKEERKKKKIG